MKWNVAKLSLLFKLITLDKKNYKQVAQILQSTPEACRKIFTSINWDVFRKNPQEAINPKPELWDKKDTIELYLLRNRDGLEWSEVARKMGKTLRAVKSRYHRMDWEKIKAELPFDAEKQKAKELRSASEEVQRIEDEEKKKKLTMYMVELSRHNIERLDEISQKDFLGKVRLKESQLPVPFAQIKRAANDYLEAQGFCFPEEVSFGAGTYIVVGDSHGKRTRRKMFELLKNLNHNLQPKKIIHVGHALDDDNDISYLWEDFDNLVVLAKQEELKTLLEKEHEYDIVRTEVRLGNLSVCNQDLIQDYVLRPVSDINRQFFPDMVVVNSHRHEFDTRCVSNGYAVIASPGCLCEKHIVKTIKQMDFTDGIQVKMSYPEGFIKYRKMKHMYKFWEQGVLIVTVAKNGSFTIVPCRIHQTRNGYATSYLDKIYVGNRVVDPDKKYFINADLHCPNHDRDVVSIQEQFCEQYKPDVHVNLGDQNDNRSLNHHEMTRNGWAIATNALEEMAYSNFVLGRMRKWAKTSYLLLGNHERFTKDFVGKLPQLKDVFSMPFVLGTNSLNINIIELKEVLRQDGLSFIHGDFKMFGSKGGSKIDKVSNTFGRNTIFGDCHYCSVRFGCYSVGFSGLMDQGYNEKNASRWIHGFAYCNIFDGIPFISNVALFGRECHFKSKSYYSTAPEAWDMKGFKAEITYSFA